MKSSKNIHILPTSKLSKIYKIKNKLYFEEYPDKTVNTGNQNLYITSDEYIGLSYYLDGNLVRKGVVDDKDYWEVRKDYKKIILTTDVYLIVDGVQAIDDEFLEWFVKNPSCERVEVKNEILYEFKDTYRPYPSECKNLTKTKVNYYLSIIPKEELTKDEIDKFFVDMICNSKEEPKQETFVNEKCFKCGRSQYSSRKPFCTDEFCNKNFYQTSKQNINSY